MFSLVEMAVEEMTIESRLLIAAHRHGSGLMLFTVTTLPANIARGHAVPGRW